MPSKSFLKIYIASDENVKYFPDFMFYNCKNLQRIVVPENVEIIGNRCFAESGLISINIPLSVKYIGTDAFLNSDLQIINYKGTKDSWGKINIDVKKSYEFANSKVIFEN